MNICREISVDLMFQKNQEQSIHDLCSLAVGLEGPIDEDSGMIINLMDIDQGLLQFKEKFSSYLVIKTCDFFIEARNFLESVFLPFHVKLSFIQLKTSWGQGRWEFPWNSWNLELIQHYRIVVNSENKQFSIYKVMTEQRGPSLDFFRRLGRRELKSLWKLRSSPKGLSSAIKKTKHLTGFAVQDFLGQYQLWFCLGFQEFSPETFRE